MDVESLRQLLDYDPATGALTWRERGAEWFCETGGRCSIEQRVKRWNSRHAGKPALTAICTGGYRHGHLLNKLVRAHCVAFALANGFWPGGIVDHVNGNPTDNRAVNLRIVTPSQNAMNRRSRGGCPFKGVSADRGRWKAMLHKNGKRHYIGLFSTPEDAARACDALAVELHGPYARLNFPHNRRRAR